MAGNDTFVMPLKGYIGLGVLLDPALGVEISWTNTWTPSLRVELLGLRFMFAAAGGGLSRVIRLRLLSGAIVVATISPAGAVPPGQTFEWFWGSNVNDRNYGNFAQCRWPNVPIEVDYTLETVTENLGADQFSDISLYLRRWRT